MKRIILFVLTILTFCPLWADVEVNETNFPDESFRNYVYNYLSFVVDDKYILTDERIASTTSLDVRNQGISSLKGIEYFTALKELRCYDNNLTSLDLSANKNLTYIECAENYLGADAMAALIASLPEVSGGELFACDGTYDHNIYTKEQVAAAKAKGWTSIDNVHNEYEGVEILCSIDETTFPDEAFRTFVNEQIDDNRDGIMVDAEVKYQTSINVADKNIASLKGIEYFTFVESLECNNNQLTTVDLSKNTLLRELYINNNQLTTVNLSKNTLLRTIYIYDNQISSEGMNAFAESLPTFHPDESTPYGEIFIIYNDENERNVCSLENIALMDSKGWYVYQMNWKYNYWDRMSMLAAVALNETNFPDENFRERIASMADENGMISGEELMNTSSLSFYCCIKNLKGLEFFTKLQDLRIYDCSELEAIDLSALSKLRYLEIEEAPNLKSLDLSKTSLNQLRLFGVNNLESIILHPSITSLSIEYCPKLSSLNVKECTHLETLGLSDIGITSLDVSGLEALVGIDICRTGGGEIESINLDGCKALRSLYIENNPIKACDLIGFPHLGTAYVKNGNLTSMKVENCEELESLDVSGNHLEKLEIKGSPELNSLYCSDNLLTKLDMDEFVSEIYTLHCDNNKLMVLDLSKAKCQDDEFFKEFQLENQNPEVVAVKLAKDQVGILFPDHFDVSKVSEITALGTEQKGDEVTIDGIHYFVFCNDADHANDLIESSNSYKYHTGFEPRTDYNREYFPEDYWKMSVTMNVTEVTKHPAFIKLASTDVVKGVYGSAAPTAPSIIRSQDYDGQLSYQSSNEKVVTVDANGKLTIVGAGKATITISGAETDYRLAPEAISYDVEIDKAKVTFAYAEEKQEMIILDEVPENKLTTGVYDGTVTYKTSDGKIATVDKNGKLTIVKAGVVTITASGAETSNCYKATPASYELTILKKESSLTLAATEANGVYGGEVTAPEVTRGNGYDGTLSYESADKKVVTVSAKGELTIVGAGETTITVSGPETDYYYAPEAVTYTVKIAKADVVFSFAEPSQEMSILGEVPANKLDKGIYDGTVSLTTDNSDIAEFDAKGALKVKTSGTVTIIATGAETANCNGPITAKYELTVLPVPGDANGDRIVNAIDIVEAVKVIKANGYNKAADINNDGKVDATDVDAIAKIIVEAK